MVIDAVGGAKSACVLNESLEMSLSKEGWEKISVPGVKPSFVGIEARA